MSLRKSRNFLWKEGSREAESVFKSPRINTLVIGCFITQGTYIKNPSRNSSSHTLSRKVTQNRLLLGGHSVRHNSALMARLIYFLIFTPLVEAAVLVFRTLFETRSWKTLKLLWRPFDKTGDEAQVGTHTQLHRNPLQGSVPMTAAAIVVSSSSGRLLSGPQNSTNTLVRPKEDEPASHAPSTTFFSIGHTTMSPRMYISGRCGINHIEYHRVPRIFEFSTPAFKSLHYKTCGVPKWCTKRWFLL